MGIRTIQTFEPTRRIANSKIQDDRNRRCKGSQGQARSSPNLSHDCQRRHGLEGAKRLFPARHQEVHHSQPQGRHRQAGSIHQKGLEEPRREESPHPNQRQGRFRIVQGCQVEKKEKKPAKPKAKKPAAKKTKAAGEKKAKSPQKKAAKPKSPKKKAPKKAKSPVKKAKKPAAKKPAAAKKTTPKKTAAKKK